MVQSHKFNCDQLSRSTSKSKLKSNWTGEIPVYNGGHLQGRLQLSDEGEEECIKEKMTVRAKQAAVFLHKKSYREWHC